MLASNVTGAQVSDPAADFARLTGTWQIDASGSTSLSSERRVITVSPEWLRIEILRGKMIALLSRIDSMARTR